MKKLLIFLCLLLPPVLQAQQTDTIKNDSLELINKKKLYSSARKASIMSALLPGLGQAYNKKYWKIPVIYAGFAGFGYLFYINNQEYQFYRKNLRAAADDDPATINTTRYSIADLQSQKEAYRRPRDLGIIGIGIIYLLNIIDANVDAHLKTFDVSDDLGIMIKPQPIYYHNGSRMVTGYGASIKIKL